jgi:hypothetical protein
MTFITLIKDAGPILQIPKLVTDLFTYLHHLAYSEAGYGTCLSLVQSTIELVGY